MSVNNAGDDREPPNRYREPNVNDADWTSFLARREKHRRRMVFVRSIALATIPGVLAGVGTALLLNGWTWGAAIVIFVNHFRITYTP